MGFVLLLNLRERRGSMRQDYRRKEMSVYHATQNTTVIKPPFQGLAWWPDGDTHFVAMQETHSSNFNLAFSCLGSEKK